VISPRVLASQGLPLPVVAVLLVPADWLARGAKRAQAARWAAVGNWRRCRRDAEQLGDDATAAQPVVPRLLPIFVPAAVAVKAERIRRKQVAAEEHRHYRQVVGLACGLAEDPLTERWSVSGCDDEGFTGQILCFVAVEGDCLVDGHDLWAGAERAAEHDTRCANAGNDLPRVVDHLRPRLPKA